MGFDVHGLSAKSEKGEHFSNNVWWWRPLACFVVGKCGLDPDGWFFNNGHEVCAAEAARIAAKLEQMLGSGEVRAYARIYAARLAQLPDEECDVCFGTGVRADERVHGTCNACAGKGSVVAWVRSYPFSEENVREFAQFCRESGGFTIC